MEEASQLRESRSGRSFDFNYVDSLRKVSNLGKRVAESCQKREAIDGSISSLFRSPGPSTHPCRAPSKDAESECFLLRTTL